MIIISLILAIILESTASTLPLVFLLLFFYAVVTRKKEIFAMAFFSGAIMDILTFKTLGVSSIYLTLSIFLVYLYQRKFEIETIPFVAAFSLLGSLIYLFLIGSQKIIFQSITASLIFSMSFLAFKFFNGNLRKI